MSQLLQLSPNFKLPAIDYAGQGNAILGIRDSGKTYTAMKAAEQLLDAGIPIIVFDPVGVWKNLKIGVGKHKGYPIVVAGGEGADIRLTTDNAVDIVRAAMKANISLVIDLYCRELINKSTWIKIVQEVVDLLMYENKDYGMRHIFLEESAEFIPQRLQPQHARVYAAIERLARMGRNARLGMTIINQRAEEVNKAILEICAFSLLHKQVGKNSLKSIQTWLELLQIENVQEIIKSLPTLKQGECWAIGDGGHPKRIQVAARNTYHPDPKKGVDPVVKMLAMDVSSFVAKMNEQLKKPEIKKPEQVRKAAVVNDNSEELVFLRKKLAEKEQMVQYYQGLYTRAQRAIENISSTTQKYFGAPVPEIPKTDTKTNSPIHKICATDRSMPSPKVNFNGMLSKCAREIIRFLASYSDRAFSKVQLGVATGYSPTSSGYSNALSELNTAGFIVKTGRIQVNHSALSEIESLLGGIQKMQYSIETYKSKLGKCEGEIFEVLLKYPYDIYSKEVLAEKTTSKYSPTSSGYNNALSRLNTLELIERSNGGIKLNPELLEVM